MDTTPFKKKKKKRTSAALLSQTLEERLKKSIIIKMTQGVRPCAVPQDRQVGGHRSATLMLPNEAKRP